MSYGYMGDCLPVYEIPILERIDTYPFDWEYLSLKHRGNTSVWPFFSIK